VSGAKPVDPKTSLRLTSLLQYPSLFPSCPEIRFPLFLRHYTPRNGPDFSAPFYTESHYSPFTMAKRIPLLPLVSFLPLLSCLFLSSPFCLDRFPWVSWKCCLKGLLCVIWGLPIYVFIPSRDVFPILALGFIGPKLVWMENRQSFFFLLFSYVFSPFSCTPLFELKCHRFPSMILPPLQASLARAKDFFCHSR